MSSQLSKSLKLSCKVNTKIKNPQTFYIGQLSTCEPHSAKFAKKNQSISLQDMLNYIDQISQKVYEDDPLSFQQTLTQFLVKELNSFKKNFLERVKLLAYSAQSLKYEGMNEIDVQIKKQWQKNVLFYLINSFWINKILLYNFTSYSQLIKQYHKYQKIIANISYYYFYSCFFILQSKKVQVFNYILNDTSNHVIHNIKNWKSVYQKLIHLIITKKNKEEWYQEEVNFDFDLNVLKINQNYIDNQNNSNQLPETTQLIRKFAKQPVLQMKIQLLKQIRAMFLEELKKNKQAIGSMKGSKKGQLFQKDDVLQSMIYCIIKGQIQNLSQSILVLNLLLGSNSSVLSKRGVDSYKADIQCAVQYLCKQQMVSPLICNPLKKTSQQTKI